MPTLVGDALERHTWTYLIGEVLQIGQEHSTHNRRACMIRCMNVDEARGVCKDLNRWPSVVSAYPHGKRREFMYARMNFLIYSSKKDLHGNYFDCDTSISRKTSGRQKTNDKKSPQKTI